MRDGVKTGGYGGRNGRENTLLLDGLYRKSSTFNRVLGLEFPNTLFLDGLLKKNI